MIGNVFQLNSLQLLQVSAWFDLLLFMPLMLLAGLQDYKKHEIVEIVCLLLGVCLLFHAVLFSNSLLACFVVALCLVFTFGPIEFSIFGQADFLLLAHFLTAYTATHTGVTILMVAGVAWLFCLCVHLVFYRDEKGNRWKPFKGMMIPALPSYSVSVLLVAILRVLFTTQLFFAGY